MDLDEGNVKSMRTPRRVCVKRLMRVDEAEEVEVQLVPISLTTARDRT